MDDSEHFLKGACLLSGVPYDEYMEIQAALRHAANGGNDAARTQALTDWTAFMRKYPEAPYLKLKAHQLQAPHASDTD